MANSISGAMLKVLLNKSKRRRKTGDPVFLLLFNLFNMAPEIDFASSNFPPSRKTASYAGYNQGRSQTQNLGGGGQIFFGRTKFLKLILFIFMKTDRLFPRSS